MLGILGEIIIDSAWVWFQSVNRFVPRVHRNIKILKWQNQFSELMLIFWWKLIAIIYDHLGGDDFGGKSKSKTHRNKE
jgi:hypothetical protein